MADKEQDRGGPLWLEVLKAIPALLWVILALVVVVAVGPDVRRLVKIGAVTKIGIGTINLELAQRRLAEVKGLDAAGIPQPTQVQLKQRFANIADYANEARILWVDDQHPQQNLRLRRVLSTISMPIDLANGTNEALKWLEQADYDIVITDLTREHDASAPCDGNPSFSRAGCDLIQKVRAQAFKKPALIVYATNTQGISSSKDLRVTNNPGDLLNAIIDAVERIEPKD
jgi:CheY-like chemotaxis protein